jgi:hypothetical protein
VNARNPFNKRERARATQNGLGYRPKNDWAGGDLPAPFAEGDVLQLAEVGDNDRLYGMGPGYFVVTYAASIDEGDAWYFRVWDGKSDRSSDRLHVVFAERSTWTDGVDWMRGFELIDTADPEGLATREHLLAEGWTHSAVHPDQAAPADAWRSLAGDFWNELENLRSLWEGTEREAQCLQLIADYEERAGMRPRADVTTRIVVYGEPRSPSGITIDIARLMREQALLSGESPSRPRPPETD